MCIVIFISKKITSFSKLKLISVGLHNSVKFKYMVLLCIVGILYIFKIYQYELSNTISNQFLSALSLNII